MLYYAAISLILLASVQAGRVDFPRGCLRATTHTDCTVTCTGKDGCNGERIQLSRGNTGRLLVVCQQGGPACNSVYVNKTSGSGDHFVFCNGRTDGDENCNSVKLQPSNRISLCCDGRDGRWGCNSVEGGSLTSAACIQRLPEAPTTEPTEPTTVPTYMDTAYPDPDFTVQPEGCLNSRTHQDCTVRCIGKDACNGETFRLASGNTGRLLIVCARGGPACNSLNVTKTSGSGEHYIHCDGKTDDSENCNSVTLRPRRTINLCCHNNGCNSVQGGNHNRDACINSLPDVPEPSTDPTTDDISFNDIYG